MPKTRLSERFLPSGKFLIAVVTFFIATLGILYFFNQYFSITYIQVDSSAKHTLNQISELKNQNLFLLSDSKTKETLLNSNPLLKTVEIEKKYPNTVILHVDFYQPQAVLEVNEGYYFLSADGKVLYKGKQIANGLPVVHYYQKLNYVAFATGERIPYKDLNTALFFLLKMRDLGLSVNTIDISSVDMIACNLDKRTIIFGVEKDKNMQEYELGVLIKQLKIQGKEFKILDLRFDKPIITF